MPSLCRAYVRIHNKNDRIEIRVQMSDCTPSPYELLHIPLCVVCPVICECLAGIFVGKVKKEHEYWCEEVDVDFLTFN